MNGFMIQTVSDGPGVILRLSGRIEAEHISQLRDEIAKQTMATALDLDQVKLVSREVISFLGTCKAQGIELQNCPAYVRDWILKEGDALGQQE